MDVERLVSAADPIPECESRSTERKVKKRETEINELEVQRASVSHHACVFLSD
jgi:hypothetical protein